MKLKLPSFSMALICIFIARILIWKDSVNIPESLIFLGLLALQAHQMLLDSKSRPDPDAAIKAELAQLKKEMDFVKEQVNSAQLSAIKATQKSPFTPRF